MVRASAANGAITDVIHTITIDPQALEYSVEGSDVVGSCPQVKAQTMDTNPIYLATGDKVQQEVDFTIGKLAFSRSYHSQSTFNGAMGYGWNWNFGWKLSLPTSGKIKIRRGGGKLMLFKDDGTGSYVRQLERQDERVIATAAGWRYTMHDRSYADFDTAGRLIALTSEAGQGVTVSYDANGYPASITGPFGRQLVIGSDSAGRITTLTGPTGRSWQYGYDGKGNLISVTYPDGSSKQYRYADSNDLHNLTGIIDEAGRQYATYAYDAQDRTVLSEHLAGKRHTVVYNSDNTVTLTEADGTVRTLTVGSAQGVFSITAVSDNSCSCGSATSFTLNPATGELVESADKMGVRNSYLYDANGRLLSQTDAVGTADARTISHSYDAAGHMLTTTDTLGYVTAYAYDPYGRQTALTDAYGNTQSWTWNGNSTLASTRSAGGIVTSYSYDALGQLTTITQADGSARHFVYDAAGRLITLTDEAGAVTQYSYDARDRLLATTYADGSSESVQYDAAGDAVTVTNRAGLITSYRYDSEHRPISMTRPDGSVQNITVDAKGNVTAQTVLEASGATALSEQMSYDANRRLTSVTHADNTGQQYSYDMLGRLLTTTDEAGRITTNQYDSLGRLISSTNPANETVHYSYDAMGRKVSVTDAAGATTLFSYDALGRVLQESSPDHGTVHYSYNADGQVVSKIDGNGVETQYGYDAMGRIHTISYPADASRNVTFSYDSAGRLVSMSDASGSTSYSYDAMSRITAANWTPNGAALTLHTGYGYDSAGRLASFTYPTGNRALYHFDHAGRLNAITTSVGTTPLSNVTYNALGEVTAQHFGNGIQEARSYDNRGRLTAISAGNVFNRAINWSPVSTISAISDSLNPAQSQSFAYDAADRLTSATGAYGSLNYGYDANSNRQSRSDATGAAAYQYGTSSNRLLQAGAVNYTLDAAGNRLADDRYSYSYGVNNRLIGVSDRAGAVIANYVHNGKGERVIKQAGGTTTYFAYDLSGNLIGEYDVSGAVILEHGYGVTGLLTSAGSGWSNARWYHNDHLGTPQVVTDNAGQAVWTVSQTPFGITTINEDPDGNGVKVSNNFRFPGQYFDAETGLNYNYFRTYDPYTGRYTQADPIGLGGGMNRFGYVGGNPVGQSDSSGLFIDAALDAGFILYDLYLLVTDNFINDCDNLSTNLAALGADVGGLFVPAATGLGLGVRATEATSTLKKIDPNKVNFSQRTVSSDVNKYTSDMSTGKWDWDRSGPLTVMERDGQLVSYDNRRLMAAQQAGLGQVPIQLVKPNDLRPSGTQTWEQSFRDRFKDKRNGWAGGVVPNTGLKDKPSVVHWLRNRR